LSWYAYHPIPSGDPIEWAIVDENFNPTLTYRAYKQVTGAEASNVGLTINLPETVSGTYSIDPQLTNLRASDVSRWELYVDGELTAEQPTLPIEWDTRNASIERHKVTVAAYTTEGSVWHSNIDETTVDNTSALCLITGNLYAILKYFAGNTRINRLLLTQRFIRRKPMPIIAS
jgi:hypothetical protein